jgi:hypothetical protein
VLVLVLVLFSEREDRHGLHGPGQGAVEVERVDVLVICRDEDLVDSRLRRRRIPRADGRVAREAEPYRPRASAAACADRFVESSLGR